MTPADSVQPLEAFMRILVALVFFVLIGTEAGAQACDTCGSRGGSGWRIIKTG